MLFCRLDRKPWPPVSWRYRRDPDHRDHSLERAGNSRAQMEPVANSEVRSPATPPSPRFLRLVHVISILLMPDFCQRQWCQWAFVCSVSLSVALYPLSARSRLPGHRWWCVWGYSATARWTSRNQSPASRSGLYLPSAIDRRATKPTLLPVYTNGHLQPAGSYRPPYCGNGHIVLWLKDPD
jgi:hypothetical protein